LSPTSMTLVPRCSSATGTFQATITSLNGFSGTVSFSATFASTDGFEGANAPNSVTVPNNGSATSSGLVFAEPGLTIEGLDTLTVTATGNGTTHSAGLAVELFPGSCP
jgi:hypothetical protein